MGVYADWLKLENAMPAAQKQGFWNVYFANEQEAYEHLLGEAAEKKDWPVKGTPEEIAVRLGLEPSYIGGFFDGINTSLRTPLDLDAVEKDTVVTLDVDLPLLYTNMLDAKAKHLSSLPQWDALLTPEERNSLRHKWLEATQATTAARAGRNDPCPCGSGKKYKKCCMKKDLEAAREEAS